MTVTVQQLIDRALTRHWAFVNVSEGAALAFINERQRAKLLQIIKTVEALIGTTTQINTQGTATLIAVDANGVPFFTTTTQDGYAVGFDANNVPFVDVLDGPFVSDPFGLSASITNLVPGGVPGIPLPLDLLRLISVSAMTTDNTLVPRSVDVLPQEISQKAPVHLGLSAFLSAGRLVPIRTDTADIWSRVTSVRLGYVACPEVTSLTDLLTVPSPCMGSMTADLCHFFALQSEKCPQQDKTRFDKEKEEAELDMISNATSLEAIVTSKVIYRR